MFYVIGLWVVGGFNVTLLTECSSSFLNMPLLDKNLNNPNLDPTLHKTYGLFSKLPFMSKLFERAFATQFTA